MRRVPVVAVAIAAVFALLAAIVAVVLRRRSRAAGPEPAVVPPPAASPGWLRRFVTARFNPVVVRLGLVGGPHSRWGYIEYVGRKSGKVYRTPVLPRMSGGHAYVPLPYGVDVAWARNVRAAGHCRVQLRGTTYDLDEPAVITAAEHPDLPERARAWLVRRGNRYLRLHVLATMPGTLDEHPIAAPAAPPETPVETTAPSLPEPAPAAASAPADESTTVPA